jgi:NADPH-dependent curcumin reductase CurA
MQHGNRFVILNRHVDGGQLDETDFSIKTEEPPEVADGQILLRTLALSIDPYLRGRMTGIDNFFLPQFVLGAPISSLGVARVVSSRNPRYKTGDIVKGVMDWSDFSVFREADSLENVGALHLLDPDLGKLSHSLGVFGLNGLTAYFGMVDVARPKQGETVLISGAAGGIGSLAGQIAKIMGARVIGIAGSQAKRDVLVHELGFDEALDYRSASFAEDLGKVMTNGPDIYFDNVGGSVSQIVMHSMRRRARVVECGQISTYEQAGGGWTVDIRPIHANGLRWESFTTAQFEEFVPGALAQLAHWVKTEKLIALETVHQGLESAPSAMVGVLRGTNVGKMVVELTPIDAQAELA